MALVGRATKVFHLLRGGQDRFEPQARTLCEICDHAAAEAGRGRPEGDNTERLPGLISLVAVMNDENYRLKVGPDLEP